MCVCVYMHVCIIICISVSMDVCVYEYVCIFVCMYACNIRMNMYVPVCMCVRAYVSVCVPVHV